MTRHLALSLVLSFAVLELSGLADEPLKKNESCHDLIFLADSRPVLLRIHVQLDGKPLLDVWNGFIKDLFARLDKNKDGILDSTEAARIPSPQDLFLRGDFGDFLGVAQPGALASKVGKVTRDELADFYRKNGGAPFNLVQSAGNGRMTASGQAEVLNKDLFAALDTDRDGKLSRKELAAAALSLLKKDADDDEMVTPGELREEAPPTAGNGLELILDGGEATTPVGDGPLMQVNAGDPAFGKALAKRLLDRYSGTAERRKAGKLSAKDLGLEAAAFKRLDANGDGQLNQEELARFSRREPDLEVIVNLGGKDGVEVKSVQGRPAFPGLKKEKDGSLKLEIGNTQLTLRLGGATRSGDFIIVNGGGDLYKMRFMSADTDGNGYLDMAEARKSGFFAGLFKAMDADGDGQLYLKEVQTYLAARKEIRERATASCVTLTLSEQGRGLFDLLDTDGDGRLSVREARNADKLLEKLDRNGDGSLSLEEIPRRFQVGARRGISNNGGGGLAFVVSGAFPGMPATMPARTQGPLWFRKMDRNNDGDVSRKEFLGTAEQFRAIDTDGDGLIDVREAEAFDAAKRRKEREQRQASCPAPPGSQVWLSGTGAEGNSRP